MTEVMTKEKTVKADNVARKMGINIPEAVLWWAIRAFLVYCITVAQTTEKAVFIGISLALTFSVSAVKLIGKNSGFAQRLPMAMQTAISLSALFGAGIGLGMNQLYNNEYYDIFLQLFAGVVGGVIGYFLAIAMKKTQTKGDVTFAAIFAFSVSGMFSIVRKICTLLIDYYTGRNLMNFEFVEDDHWLIELLGPMMSMNDQRPIYDMNEDFILSFLGSVITSGLIYTVLRVKNKAFFVKEKLSPLAAIKNMPKRMKAKVLLEIEKVRRDTNIFDILFWWIVRFAMAYAVIEMYFVRKTTAEAILVFANFVGTFGITIAHFLFPKDSIVCKISYKVQTLLMVIIFLGSYCGNYVFVYNWVGRFDLFIHFISGYLVVMMGYYLARTLFTEKSAMSNIRLASFATAFSFAIIPAWEAMEFTGDYIWGTQNQGFLWWPKEDSFFFKFFGQGVGNTQLYYFFDTAYDSLLAIVLTVITGIGLYAYLEVKRRRELKKI